MSNKPIQEIKGFPLSLSLQDFCGCVHLPIRTFRYYFIISKRYTFNSTKNERME